MTDTLTVRTELLKEAIDEALDHRLKGEHAEALRCHENTRRFFEGDPVQFRRFYCGVGMSYMGLHQFEQAEAAYREALTIPVSEEWERSEVAAIQGNLASCLIQLDRTAEAHSLLDEAIPILSINPVDAEWLGDKWECRSRIYFREGDYLLAMKAAKKAQDILWPDLNGLGRAIRTLAMAFDECERRGLFHTKRGDSRLSI